jgi:inner membrane protein
MKSLKTNIFFKISMIIIIGLLLLIPTVMIKSLIYEREMTQKEAISEVGSKWGGEQTLSGPYISVPYHKYIKQFSKKDSVEKMVLVREYIHFLPSELKISGNISPERRNRGIYEIVVYNSNLTFSGVYNNIKFSDLDIPLKDIQFDKAIITLGISDLRGIERLVDLNWNQDKYSFNPGTVTNDILESGINAPVNIASDDSSSYNFSFNLDLKGSQLLYFIPVGEVTDVKMTSTWGNPSFNGAFLPDSRKISDSGFVANWNILHLNRNYPQKWLGSASNPRLLDW